MARCWQARWPRSSIPATLSPQQMTPGRMLEHVLVEEVAVQLLLLLLLLALLGAVVQGTLWLFRLRRAAAVPILLLPPAKVLLRALLLGIALPMLLYWLYTRCPVIGGREFGWSSGMRPRFMLELCVLGLLMLWLPALIIRRYLARRCADLGIALPTRREERLTNWQVRGAGAAALLLLAAAMQHTVYLLNSPAFRRAPGQSASAFQPFFLAFGG